MPTNPLHEKLIEEFFGKPELAPYRKAETEWLRTAFLQIEQATREECAKICKETRLQEYYCTSGCGCEYPNGDGSHEYSCDWKPYHSARELNILLDRAIAKLTT